MILIIIFTKKSLNKYLSYQQGNKFTPKELKDCPEYGKPRISFGWCLKCETNSMKENFPYWTSRNKEIDELIRYIQLNATQACDYLEWIPFEKFEMVKYVGKAGTFGITKDPTSSYMIVMKYYENGNLYQYLDHCNGIIHSERKSMGIFTEEIYLSKTKRLNANLISITMIYMINVEVEPFSKLSRRFKATFIGPARIHSCVSSSQIYLCNSFYQRVEAIESILINSASLLGIISISVYN
ncbi:hypothetical protein RhiirA4_521103 [Rhizophagus irregularis]|uniref:Protein kinase domain-containing protein n=1 Tax=Rhizophagus irregularis TaxID=588596 RepID=A0A2I1GJW9_9GLOM|nr:hypothetical protein RhiirA4_521103 [Rhizophagus irregularis]